MLPEDHLWPIDEVWNYHAGGGAFKNLNIFTEALERRYGKATGVEDYAQKAQVMAYDGERAMFEAYGAQQVRLHRRHPVDAEQRLAVDDLAPLRLLPAARRRLLRHQEGLRAAAHPVLLRRPLRRGGQRFYQEFKGLKASAKIYNLDMTEKFSQAGDRGRRPRRQSPRVHRCPKLEGLSSTYFVRLTLADAAGKPVSSNFYWLSTKTT